MNQPAQKKQKVTMEEPDNWYSRMAKGAKPHPLKESGILARLGINWQKDGGDMTWEQWIEARDYALDHTERDQDLVSEVTRHGWTLEEWMELLDYRPNNNESLSWEEQHMNHFGYESYEKGCDVRYAIIFLIEAMFRQHVERNIHEIAASSLNCLIKVDIAEPKQ